MRNNKQKGFSLIELLIVVAIILIIAAIAIPNLLRSKMAANEASAVASLRTLNTTEILYSNTYNSLSTDLASLGPDPTGITPTPKQSDLIDSVLAGGVSGAAPVAGVLVATKSGYLITYTPGAVVGGAIPTYTITAVPTSVGGTGLRGFATDQSGVIHQNSATPLLPVVTDPPL